MKKKKDYGSNLGPVITLTILGIAILTVMKRYKKG